MPDSPRWISERAAWLEMTVGPFTQHLKDFQARHNLGERELSKIVRREPATLRTWLAGKKCPATREGLQAVLDRLRKWEEEQRLARVKKTADQVLDERWIGNRVQQKEAPPGVVLIPAEQ